jgi:methyltransferase
MPALVWGGLLLFAAGQTLRLWCMHVLGTRWNARARIDPALRVESSGPYRWIRHPNYLGLLLEVLGLPLAAGAWITLALVLPAHACVLRARMRGEDELLHAVPGYAEAMGGKGALLPRRSARRSARKFG